MTLDLVGIGSKLVCGARGTDKKNFRVKLNGVETTLPGGNTEKRKRKISFFDEFLIKITELFPYCVDRRLMCLLAKKSVFVL